MKASDFGALPPAPAGAWSFNDIGRELWYGDHFPTREEAIAAGRAEFGPSAAFEICRFAEVEVSGPDATEAMECALDRLCDEVPSDVVEGYLYAVPPEQRARLDAALEKAFGEWLTETANWPDFCKVADVERIEPEAA